MNAWEEGSYCFYSIASLEYIVLALQHCSPGPTTSQGTARHASSLRWWNELLLNV